MALLYRCDICGKEVEPGDTYGPGVITDEKAGRPNVWYRFVGDGEAKLGLSVMPFAEGTDGQICGACVGKAMREMVEELWPEGGNGEGLPPLGVKDMLGFQTVAEEYEAKLAQAAKNPEVVQVVEAGPRPLGCTCPPSERKFFRPVDFETPCPIHARPGVPMGTFPAGWSTGDHTGEFKVDLPPGIPDGALLRVNHPDRSKSTNACGAQCQPTHCHYTDNGECYHVEQQRERTGDAHPNGADREDRHLHAVRPVEPVPDPGPAERPEPILADRSPAIRPELGLPTPTHCPDCGGPLPDQHQQWCQYFK